MGVSDHLYVFSIIIWCHLLYSQVVTASVHGKPALCMHVPYSPKAQEVVQNWGCYINYQDTFVWRKSHSDSKLWGCSSTQSTLLPMPMPYTQLMYIWLATLFSSCKQQLIIELCMMLILKMCVCLLYFIAVSFLHYQ